MKRGGPIRRNTRLRSNAATQQAWETRTREKLRAAGKPQPRLGGTRKGTSLRRGADLDEARAFVKARAGGKCEANWPGVCPDGPHRGVHAHHIRLRSQGGEDDASNLLWLCRAVHDHAHAHPAEAQKRGVIRMSKVPPLAPGEAGWTG